MVTSSRRWNEAGPGAAATFRRCRASARCRHLEVKEFATRVEPRHVVIPNVPTVFAQVRRDAVGPGLDASRAAADRVGQLPPRALRTVATWSMLTPSRRCLAPGVGEEFMPVKCALAGQLSIHGDEAGALGRIDCCSDVKRAGAPERRPPRGAEYNRKSRP